MSKFKLTIITINYNNREGLKRTLESVANQSWQEFEYIVIDGGSSDGSAEYLQSQKQHIDYWVSEPDKGVYNAMNKGMQKATGSYLLFLNSGDHLFDNEVLNKNNHYLINYDLVSFDVLMVGNNANRILSSPYTLRFYDLYYHTLPHPSTFIKKELFDEVGAYDESLKIVSDWKFFILALFKYQCSYIKIKETVSVFYLDGISSNSDFSEEKKQVFNDYFKCFVKDYEELQNNRVFRSNRFKMLQEIEKSLFGRKVVSVFFRIYLIVFSKKSLNDILN